MGHLPVYLDATEVAHIHQHQRSQQCQACEEQRQAYKDAEERPHAHASLAGVRPICDVPTPPGEQRKHISFGLLNLPLVLGLCATHSLARTRHQSFPICAAVLTPNINPVAMTQPSPALVKRRSYCLSQPQALPGLMQNMANRSRQAPFRICVRSQQPWPLCRSLDPQR
jgi:hypothetical protein